MALAEHGLAIEEIPADPMREIELAKEKLAAEQETEAVKQAILKEITDYLNQFQGTKFGKAIKLGDPEKFKAAIDKNINRVYVGQAGKDRIKALSPDALAFHHTWRGIGLTADLVFPFDPRSLPDGKESAEHRKTMMHEMSHHLEWLKGRKEGKEDIWGNKNPLAERNTNYQDAVIDALKDLAKIESELESGKLSVIEALGRWASFEQRMHELEIGASADGTPPDMALESISGFSARYDQLESHYLSGQGSDKMRFMVSLYQQLWRVSRNLDTSPVTVKRCAEATVEAMLVDTGGNNLGFPPDLKPELTWTLPNGSSVARNTLRYIPSQEGAFNIQASLSITFKGQTLVLATGEVPVTVEPNPGVGDCAERVVDNQGKYIVVQHRQSDWYCTNRPEIIAKAVLPPILWMMGTPPVPVPLPIRATPDDTR
jgi:hypothetical protein